MAWAPYEPIIIQPATANGSTLYATYWRLSDFWVWNPNTLAFIDPTLQNESDWPPLSEFGVDGLTYVPWYNGGGPATLTGIYYLDTGVSGLTAAGTYLVLIKSCGLAATRASNDPIQAYGLLTIRTADHYAFQRLVEGDNMGATAAAATTIAGQITTDHGVGTYVPDNTNIGVAATAAAAVNARLPASPAAVGSAMTLTSGERDAVAAALLDLADGVESSYTLRQSLRLMAAALAGKRSNAGTATEQYDAIGAPGTPRIVGNLNSSGDGTPTLTP